MAEVLSVLPDGQSYFSASPLRRSSPSQTSLYSSSPRSFSPKSRPHNPDSSEIISSSVSSSERSSPRLLRFDISHNSPVLSTPPSSLSLDASSDEDNDEDHETSVNFPSYGVNGGSLHEGEEARALDLSQQDSSSLPQHAIEQPPTATDDTAARPEPSQHVDYLSHDWEEEDIAASWRHIVSRRKIYGERSRLENASWRTWAKSKYSLKTVSPETLNWLKDCDVTWLYGPLQTAQDRHLSVNHNTSEPASRLSKSNSFIHKKPILKKRSVSELMLQKSLSASSLVKQAAASVQAQQTSYRADDRPRPTFDRTISDFVSTSSSSKSGSRELTNCLSSRSTSGLHTPDNGEKKHIRFDEKVEQCIAVDVKDGEYDEEEDDWAAHNDDDDSSDDGLVMMKSSNKKKSLSRNNSRTSFSGENKTIEKLEPTTLKYRTDSPDVTEQATAHSLGFYRSSRLSPSPSQATLRPSNPSTNFLLSEEDEDDMAWEPSSAYGIKSNTVNEESTSREAAGLRRTESGMFMPFEDENGEPGNGILGRVVDTVNTARDIAHVIWNVGWRN